MFPTAGSVIHYNEAGEVLGWDSSSYDEPEYCDTCGYNHSGDCPDEEDEEEDPPAPTDSWCETCESMNCTCY